MQASEWKFVTSDRFRNVLIGKLYACEWFKMHPSSLAEEDFFVQMDFCFLYVFLICLLTFKIKLLSFNLKTFGNLPYLELDNRKEVR